MVTYGIRQSCGFVRTSLGRQPTSAMPMQHAPLLQAQTKPDQACILLVATGRRRLMRMDLGFLSGVIFPEDRCHDLTLSWLQLRESIHREMVTRGWQIWPESDIYTSRGGRVLLLQRF